MDYEIKTYQDGFIEDQFKIGSAIYDHWPMGGQTRPDELHKIYDGEDFDPNTKFYAFKDGEMVGFLTSTFKQETKNRVEYFFEFPYTKPNHQKASTQLIEHAINELEMMGATVLIARAGDYWGKSKKWAIQYGFDETIPIARRGELTVEDQIELDDQISIDDFDFNIHGDTIIKHISDQNEVSEEQIRQRLRQWKERDEGYQMKNPWDQTLTLLADIIVKHGEKITGRTIGMNVSTFGENTMNVMQFQLIEDIDRSTLGGLLQGLIDKAKVHGKSTIVIHTGLWGTDIDENRFNSFGIDFETKLSFYEKYL